MEGTLGSADRAPLRGGSQEAALPEGPVKTGSPGTGLAQASSSGELVTGARFVHPTGAAPPAVFVTSSRQKVSGPRGSG
jgi:hypothetical protein